MIDQIFNFYLEKSDPNKSCLLALRDIILNHDKNISKTLKYGMPCFCYKDKVLCYIWTDKKTDEPYILMVEGKHLTHPKLESGDRKKMKIFRVKPNVDLPIHSIQEILGQALDLHKKR